MISDQDFASWCRLAVSHLANHFARNPLPTFHLLHISTTPLPNNTVFQICIYVNLGTYMFGEFVSFNYNRNQVWHHWKFSWEFVWLTIVWVLDYKDEVCIFPFPPPVLPHNIWHCWQLGGSIRYVISSAGTLPYQHSGQMSHRPLFYNFSMRTTLFKFGVAFFQIFKHKQMLVGVWSTNSVQIVSPRVQIVCPYNISSRMQNMRLWLHQTCFFAACPLPGFRVK